jgi:co-chaperonin GroES (HSP10)
MKFIPRGNRVLLSKITEATTSSGIILTENKDKVSSATVIEVGDKVEGICVGMKIHFIKYSGAEILVDGQKLTVMSSDDILGHEVLDEQP